MTIPAFDPLAALKNLIHFGVEFVVIGGFASRILGSPLNTNDLDICYSRTPDNLERLAVALTDMGARLRGAPDDVPFQLDAATLKAGDHFTFITKFGAFDILGTPAGSEGFNGLARSAEKTNLDGLEVLVASIDDLITMKLAAGRSQDLYQAEILGALREEIDSKDS